MCCSLLNTKTGSENQGFGKFGGRSRVHLHFVDEDIGARVIQEVGGQPGTKVWSLGSGVQGSILYFAHSEKGTKTQKTIQKVREYPHNKRFRLTICSEYNTPKH